MKVKEQLWLEPEYDLELAQVTDMHVSKMNNSRYVRKEDVDPPILVTIFKINEKDVSAETDPPDVKWILHFSDHDKPLVLNQTNIALITIALKTEETDDWIGKKIVLYNDPTVSYAGKITGGVRVRAPKNVQQQPAETQASHEFDDDLPF